VIYLKANHIALLLILGLAFVLRMNGILWGLPSEYHPQHSYHPDEWVAILWATQLYSGMVLDAHFGYGGTLYISFIQVCLKLSSLLTDWLPGYNAFANSILVTRFVLLVVSLLSIFLLYVIASKLYNPRSGLLAALILSVTPAHVIWAQRVRVDELASLMVLLIFYLAVCVYQQRTVAVRFWLLAGVSVGAATALRAPLLLFAVAPIIGLVLSQPNIKDIRYKTFFKPVSVYLLSILLAYIGFSPYSLLYFDNLIGGLALQRQYQSSLFVEAVGLGPVWWQYLRYMLPQALGWPVFLLFIVATIWVARFRDKRVELIFYSMLPSLIVTALVSWVVVRYTIPLLPFLILIIIAFLHNLHAIAQVRKIVLPGVILLLVLTLSFLLPFQSLNASKNIRDEIHDWMSTAISPGATVLTLRSYSNDVFFEPNIPKGINRVFVRYPLKMQCDQCYQFWNYDYLILSDPLLTNIERLKADYPQPEMWDFYTWLRQSHELVKEFDRNPRWFGVDIQGMYSAHDMNYSSPAYRIYRKSENK